ncbi:MAG: TIGR00366 family protein [Gemmatimonadetes bacterium]|nr:TIGR00366 family protein [Gemmatimonadota bacterium]
MPLLAITGLHARDVFGYAITMMLVLIPFLAIDSWDLEPFDLSPLIVPEHETEQETDGDRQGGETSDRGTDQAADSNQEVQYRRLSRPNAASGG